MGFYTGSIELELGFLDPLSVLYSALSHEKPALGVKISKRTDDFKSSLVFGDPSITDMVKTKDFFNDQKWMFAFSSYLGLCSVFLMIN